MEITRNPSVADQLYDFLAEQIRSGEYEPGERLPSEPQLSENLHVSRSSVRAALAKLQMAGFVTRKHGDGTYVARQAAGDNHFVSALWEFSSLIAGLGRTCHVQPVSIERRPAADAEAVALELPVGEPVVIAKRLFLADTTPAIFTIDTFPASIFKVDPCQEDFSLPITDFLRRYSDEEIAYARTEISATIAPEEVCRALALKPGSAVLNLWEVFFDTEEERPLLLSDTYLESSLIHLKSIRNWHYRPNPVGKP